MKGLLNRFWSSDTNPPKPSLESKTLATATEVIQFGLDDQEGHFYKCATQQEKDELKAEILTITKSLFEETDPIDALRLVIVNYAMSFGESVVLSTTPNYAMFKGISGKLHERVFDLAKCNEDARKVLDRLGVLSATQDEMVNALRGRAHFINLPLTALNAVRIELGDWDSDGTKDWLRPLIISCQIHSENCYRTSLGIDSALERQMEAIVYSGFPSLVLGGYKNPREEWESRWMKTFNKPSPFSGIDMYLVNR